MIGFQIVTEHTRHGLLTPPPPTKHNLRHTLFNYLWFEVEYFPYHRFDDGSESLEHIQVRCTPFPFIYLNIVDLGKVRDAIRELCFLLPVDPQPFPPEHWSKEIQSSRAFKKALKKMKGKR